MKTLIWLAPFLMMFARVLPAETSDSCHYLKSRDALVGYDTGGPYKLDHFKLTKGRTDLRDFLWSHWHGQVKGIAEAKVGTIDAGVITVVYVVQPDANDRWGIDVELYRPVQPPPCSAFHVNSIVRFPIRKPEDDTWQTLGPYLPDGKLPRTLLVDSEVKDTKFYKVILVQEGKAIGDSI